MNYKDLRKEYILHQLDPDLMVESPIDQFRNWFDEAISAHANEANAMVLSTVSKEGKPSSRYLLLISLPIIIVEKRWRWIQIHMYVWFFTGEN